MADERLPDEIDVDGGRVHGTRSWGAGVRMFRGIPYAAPPVGTLRWRPPQPVERWSGVRPAERFAPAPVQRQRPLYEAAFNTGIAGYSEDCLYLNVWTPARSARLANGLFHRAIGQSHSVFGPMMDLAAAERRGLELSAQARAPSLNALRALPAEDVHAAFVKQPAAMNAAIVDG
jgi:carboxylesterase type B